MNRYCTDESGFEMWSCRTFFYLWAVLPKLGELHKGQEWLTYQNHHKIDKIICYNFKMNFCAGRIYKVGLLIVSIIQIINADQGIL